VQGVLVRFTVDVSAVRLVVEGVLPEQLVARLVEEVRENIEQPCVLERC
jgi:hypothetical protein